MKKKIVVVALIVGLSFGLGCTTTPTASVAGNGATTAAAEVVKYDRDGFVTRLDKRGHLWVFYEGSKALAAYDSKGTPAKHTVRPLAGPGRTTLKEAEDGTINAYLMARPGFATRLDKRGHLWVFKAGGKALADYDSKGAPAKHTARPLAGPNRTTLKEAEDGTIDAYLKAREYPM